MKKRLKTTAIIILSTITIGLVLNWYLTDRLEKKLREVIARRVSEATNGFYSFSYDKLSIGFFSGELKLEGAKFSPDSLTFSELKQLNNLPETYIDVSVGSVHLKGINLTWRRDYKELDFKLLEIFNPNVLIYGNERSFDKKGKSQKTLASLDPDRFYLLIEPYVNELTISKVNLEQATVIYNLIKEDHSKGIYSLKNINFYCYNFLLNNESANSGKLLFCDNFEFSTRQNQQLLDDSSFLLDVSEIYLSTQDSIIRINGASLTPKLSTPKIEESENSVIQASVDSIRLKGAYFYRHNRLSHLEADSFKIMSSEIFYLNKKKENIATKADSIKLVDPWSLHSIISPVLKSVSIKNISIDNAMMDYWVSTKENFTDKYQMQSFDFDAHGFRVKDEPTDSTRLFYSDDIFIRAAKIRGNIYSKNHRASIDLLEFDTNSKLIEISDVEVSPITTKTDYDYINGHLHSLTLKNVIYKNDMTVERLTIIKPKLKYTRVKENELDKNSKAKNLNIIESFVDFLKVDKIDLIDGSVTFEDEIRDDQYTLDNFNFSVNKFVLHKDIPKDLSRGLEFGKLGFNFKNFDNLSPDKSYRLKVASGQLENEYLRLTGIELIPQDTLLKNPYKPHIQLSTPSIDLHANFVEFINNDTLDIRYLYIDQPYIKFAQAPNAKMQQKKESNYGQFPFTYINVDSLRVENPKFILNDSISDKYLNTYIEKLNIDAFSWDIDKYLVTDRILLQNPKITYYSTNSTKRENQTNAFLKQEIGVNSFMLLNPKLNLKSNGKCLDVDAKQLSLKGYHSKLYTDDSFLKITSFALQEPTIRTNLLSKRQGEKTNLSQLSDSSFYGSLGSLAENIQLDKFAVNNLNVFGTDSAEKTSITNTSLNLYDLKLNTPTEEYSLSGIDFHTEDINIPLDNGFYTLSIDKIDLSDKGNRFRIDDIKLRSPFSKMDFAYKHPKHKDWFDVTVENIEAKGLDIPYFLKNKRLNIDQLSISNTLLQNFKNQQIEVPHRIIPMIYEGIQNLPFGLDIDRVNIQDFNVTYEELAKKGKIPGKIFFTDMNSQISDFTNIAKHPEQFIRLQANGKFMGVSHLDATWLLPVDKGHDRFLLDAKLYDFDLKELNQLITPLFPASVRSGHLDSLQIAIDASSIEAKIQMQLLYNSLIADVLKEKNGELSRQQFYTWLANIVIRNNNPNRLGKQPRTSNLNETRDPYHSTFNYFWQIIRPAAAEAVGVSEKVQKLSKDNIFTRLKAKFRNEKKEESGTEHTH